jgi:hypothetical protein
MCVTLNNIGEMGNGITPRPLLIKLVSVFNEMIYDKSLYCSNLAFICN